MVAKRTQPPRPKQNAKGSPKQPSANPDGGGAPVAPGAPPQGQPGVGPPSTVPPGGPPPMHQIAAQSQAAQGGPPGGGGPGGGMPPPPPGADQGINPSQWPHNQVREGINFKDLPPLGQAQAQEQEGINPAAPLQMIQGQLQSSLGEQAQQEQTGQQSPVPPAFIGPMTPPGVENFPHDYAALQQVMARGYSPGADNGEHAMAQNAHAMVRAAEQQSQNAAAQGAHDDMIKQHLGGLLQSLSASHAVPDPAAVAEHIRRKQIPGLKGPTGQPTSNLASSMY